MVDLPRAEKRPSDGFTPVLAGIVFHLARVDPSAHHILGYTYTQGSGSGSISDGFRLGFSQAYNFKFSTNLSSIENVIF